MVATFPGRIVMSIGDSFNLQLPDGQTLTVEQTEDDLRIQKDFDGILFQHPTSILAKGEDRYLDEDVLFGGEG